MASTVYQEYGYQNRQDYLKCLADDYGLPLSVVKVIADTLGPNEDFDGLVTELDDAVEMFSDMNDMVEE